MAAAEKSEFGVCGVAGGMMAIEMLAGTMRLDRGGIAAGEMTAIDKIGSAFLRRILLRMKELGVSQTELAKRMKVSRPYITKVLHQDVNITFRTAAKLASAL